MLKMLFYAVLNKITVSQVCLNVIPCNFLLYSGESQVIVTSFTHIHSSLPQNLFLFNFSIAGKYSKCCFMLF